jgi:hypothetical protein
LLFKQPWFFGFIRKDEAATLLAHALHEDRSALGYFLMRFSCTHKGSYVLHMINRDGHLFQRIIAHSYSNEFTVALDDVHATEYNSVFALLRDCNQCDTCLKGMVPLNNSPFAKYFKNYQIENIATYRSSDSTNSDNKHRAKVVLPTAGATTTAGAAAAPATAATGRQQPATTRQPTTTTVATRVAPSMQQQVHRRPQQAATGSAQAALATQLRPQQQQQQQHQQQHQQQQHQQHQQQHQQQQTRPATTERQLAGRTISLVSAARTASSAAAAATTSQNTSRWHSSMSSRKSNSRKEAEKKDLLKLL